MLAVQLGLSIAIARHAADQLNPDAVAYGRMAAAWAAWRPDLALNATWGVLSAWLAVPWLALGADPVDALRGSQIACGIFVTLGTEAILASLAIPRRLRTPLVLAAALQTTYSATLVLAADTAYVAVFVWLCWALLTPRPRIAGITRPLVAGLLAGLAYLARPIGLPLAGCLLVGTEIVRATRKPRCDHPSRTVALALTGWAIVALPWIATLSFHYGRFTLTHSAALVQAAVGPHTGHPWNLPSFTHLHRPPEGRVTTWEDPALVSLADLQWSPFESASAWTHQRRLIASNLPTLLATLAATSGIGLAVAALLPAALLGLAQPRPGVGWRDAWLVFAPLLQTAALAPLHIEQRYVWPLVPILLGALGVLATRLDAMAASGGTPRRRVMHIVSAVLVLVPVIHHGAIALDLLRLPMRRERALVDHWAAAVRAAGAAGPVVSWTPYPEKALDPEGLYLAWRLDTPWLANLAVDGSDLRRAVELGARVLVVKTPMTPPQPPDWITGDTAWEPLLAEDVRAATLRDGRYAVLFRR